MHEQPTVIADALARYLDARPRRASPLPAGIDFAGCDRWCSSPAAPRTTPATWRSTGSRASPACRSRSRSPPSSATASRRSAPGTLGIFVSQSGETADTLAALRYVQGAGRPHRLGRQRRDLDHRPRERRGAADPRRPRDRRRLDQGLHLPAHRARGAGASPPPASAAASTPPRRPASPPRSPPSPACSPGRWRSSREIAEIARDLARARDVLFLGRGADVSAGARRRAEAEGDQLHPRRRLCVGRAEARADRADRRGRAGDRARALATRSSTRPSRTCRR